MKDCYNFAAKAAINGLQNMTYKAVKLLICCRISHVMVCEGDIVYISLCFMREARQ